MNTRPRYRRILSGEAGLWAAPIRGGLAAASFGYSLLIRLRNQRYDAAPARVVKLPVPVISVGNVTTGGTGKTPMVLELVRRLHARGRRPAVLSRGYRSKRNRIADELQLVRRRAHACITVADPDRVAGGREAVARGADVLVLDDAFQHRRIDRNLDLVMLDAMCPFGYGHVLPRGLLREPLDGLARADLIVLSRTDAVSPARVEGIVATVRRYNADAPILRTRHRPVCLQSLGGDRTELTALHGRNVICVAGIGHPEAFLQTVKQIGAAPVCTVRLPDHARYDARVYRRLSAAAKLHPQAAYLVTTEKDLVKLDRDPWRSFPLPIVAVTVDIDLLDGGGTMLDAALDRILTPRSSEEAHAEQTVPAR